MWFVVTPSRPLPYRKSLCPRSSRWRTPETTAVWPRAATLTASRSSQPPWCTTWERTTAATTTALLWLPRGWAWRSPRAGRRPSDRPWCPSPPSPVWPVLPDWEKITVSLIYKQLSSAKSTDVVVEMESMNMNIYLKIHICRIKTNCAHTFIIGPRKTTILILHIVFSSWIQMINLKSRYWNIQREKMRTLICFMKREAKVPTRATTNVVSVIFIVFVRGGRSAPKDRRTPLTRLRLRWH